MSKQTKWLQDNLDTVILGDAFELSKNIPDNSVDLVFTDPPWGIGYKYSTDYDDGVGMYKYICDFIVSESNRVLKPGGYSFVYQATKRLRETWQWFPENSRLFSQCKNFIQILPSKIQYAVDYIVFWDKDNKDKNDYIRDYFVANTAITKNGSRGLGINKKIKTSPPRPIDATQYIVNYMCPQNGIVLDFFMGSATTARAAIRTGKHFIGFELYESVWQTANMLIEKERMQTNMFDVEGVEQLEML